jgi:hypothetical protein
VFDSIDGGPASPFLNYNPMLAGYGLGSNVALNSSWEDVDANVVELLVTLRFNLVVG